MFSRNFFTSLSVAVMTFGLTPDLYAACSETEIFGKNAEKCANKYSKLVSSCLKKGIPVEFCNLTAADKFCAPLSSGCPIRNEIDELVKGVFTLEKSEPSSCSAQDIESGAAAMCAREHAAAVRKCLKSNIPLELCDTSASTASCSVLPPGCDPRDRAQVVVQQVFDQNGKPSSCRRTTFKFAAKHIARRFKSERTGGSHGGNDIAYDIYFSCSGNDDLPAPCNDLGPDALACLVASASGCRILTETDLRTVGGGFLSPLLTMAHDLGFNEFDSAVECPAGSRAVAANGITALFENYPRRAILRADASDTNSGFLIFDDDISRVVAQSEGGFRLDFAGNYVGPWVPTLSLSREASPRAVASCFPGFNDYNRCLSQTQACKKTFEFLTTLSCVPLGGLGGAIACYSVGAILDLSNLPCGQLVPECVTNRGDECQLKYPACSEDQNGLGICIGADCKIPLSERKSGVECKTPQCEGSTHETWTCEEGVCIHASEYCEDGCDAATAACVDLCECQPCEGSDAPPDSSGWALYPELIRMPCPAPDAEGCEFKDDPDGCHLFWEGERCFSGVRHYQWFYNSFVLNPPPDTGGYQCGLDSTLLRCDDPRAPCAPQ